MTAQTSVRLFPHEVQQLLESEQGPVIRHTIRIGEDVKTEAKRLVGVRSGDLKNSIVKRFLKDASGPGVFVIAEKPYAIFHHEPTRPHVIVPRRKRALHWIDKSGGVRRGRGGRFQSGSDVFTQRVNHPGTKGNPFLVQAVRNVFTRLT